MNRPQVVCFPSGRLVHFPSGVRSCAGVRGVRPSTLLIVSPCEHLGTTHPFGQLALDHRFEPILPWLR
jgi:hypothetical protein